MLNPCTELPSYDTPNGDNCLATLQKEFTFIKTIGGGFWGTAALLNRHGKEIVVKMSDLTNVSLVDISVGCSLNSLRGKTGIFVHTFGWLLCDKILYIFMDHGGYSWDDKSIILSKKDAKSILFLILHGLYVARRHLEFSHDDLHFKNILLKPISPATELILDGGYVIKAGTTRFIPQIIDFGISRTKRYRAFAEKPAEDMSRDVYMVQQLFVSRTNPDEKGIKKLKLEEEEEVVEKENLRFLEDEFFDNMDFGLAKSSRPDDWKIIYTLLQRPFFDDIVVRNQPTEIEARCLACSGVGTMQWEHNDDHYVFCSEGCADTLAPIKEFLIK